MVGIRRFIWPEYITIVLKRSLLTMAFSTQSMFGTTEEVFFSNWVLVAHIGKDNAIAQKPIPHSINLVEKWNTILIIQGGRFSCTNRPRSRSFQAAQLRGIKVGFIFSKKTIGF
jgi:hypothetical protein